MTDQGSRPLGGTGTGFTGFDYRDETGQVTGVKVVITTPGGPQEYQVPFDPATRTGSWTPEVPVQGVTNVQTRIQTAAGWQGLTGSVLNLTGWMNCQYQSATAVTTGHGTNPADTVTGALPESTA